MSSPAPQQGDSVAKNWVYIRDLIKRVDALTATVQNQQRLIDGLRKNVGDLQFGQHPFRIYQIPQFLRAEPSENDWRKVRVRSGRIGNFDETMIAGTDEELIPDLDTYPDDASFEDGLDILVPAGVLQYLIWVTIENSETAYISHGEDPTLEDWPDFPEPDGKHIPLGWVDTMTYEEEKRVLIRQLLRTDLVVGIKTTDCDGDEPHTVYVPGFYSDPPEES